MRTGRRRARQSGFTLIEIMVALIVSSLLVAMILSIFTTMSVAYRTQQQVAELQQILQAAEVTLEGDLRQAGFRCQQGFTWAGSSVTPTSPIIITDGGTGAQQPDQIAIFYGDPSAQAQVQIAPSAPFLPAWPQVTVDAVDPTWTVGDLVLFSVQSANPMGGFGTGGTSWEAGATRPPEEPVPGDSVASSASLAYYFSCVLQIASINGTSITFSTAGPWGNAGNTQCATPIAQIGVFKPMLYKFVARAYRIDPTRKDLSVLQVSPSGGLLASDWTDLGLGFTNFQIASRWFEYNGVDNADTDADPRRNWYSGTQQTGMTAADATYTMKIDQIKVPLQVSVSFVVRTTRHVVDGTVTAATPVLQDPANPSYNDIGDSPSVTLAGVSDASRPQELRGDNIYRYATIKVDTRNMGINR